MSDWVILLIVGIPVVVGQLMALGEVVLARADLSRTRRVVWAACLIGFPYIALAAYAIARPPAVRTALERRTTSSDERARAAVLAVEQQVAGEIADEDYDRRVAPFITSGS